MQVAKYAKDKWEAHKERLNLTDHMQKEKKQLLIK